MIVIEAAQWKDLPNIFALLTASGLPQEGLRDHLPATLVARDGDEIVGSVALEIYESLALLRSVAVDTRRRGQRLGQQLTQAALDLARQHNLTHVYLLTETASDFFARFGFRLSLVLMCIRLFISLLSGQAFVQPALKLWSWKFRDHSGS